MVKLTGLVPLLSLLLACSDPPSTGAPAYLAPAIADAKQVKPDYRLQFPQDHVSHPEHAIEWWYLTANLFDQQGRQYPLQWTLFRFLSEQAPNSWANNQQFMAHAKLTSKSDSWFEERFARGGVGNAGVSPSPLHAYLDDWAWRALGDELFPASLGFRIDHQVQARLQLRASQPTYVLHGEQGYSRKFRNSRQASYYYSQPFVEVSGVLSLPEGKVEVSGQGWFDHEWTSSLLDDKSQGWDWFSIHLNSGDKLMLFAMRHQQQPTFWSGTFIRANGDTTHLDEAVIVAKVEKFSSVGDKSLPLHWSIQLPQQGIDIQVAPFKLDQWNPGIFEYYEGAIQISGSHEGVGFMELTGY